MALSICGDFGVPECPDLDNSTESAAPKEALPKQKVCYAISHLVEKQITEKAQLAGGMLSTFGSVAH